MPKVTFINEHRTVDVEAGRTIAAIATELGIATCREEFAGTGFGNHTVWVKGADGALSPPGFLEKLFGARGMKRLANRAKILGDVEVWTQAAVGDRLRAPRPISPNPNPLKDPTAPRKPIDASGSAAFPYGDPRAVGKGTREAVARSTAKAKPAGKGKAGRGGRGRGGRGRRVASRGIPQGEPAREPACYAAADVRCGW